jgi:dihydrofolate reductase
MKKGKINLIVAVASNGVIGANNSLPWKRLKDDIAFFKKMTTGAIILSGRKNYESIPEKYRPLSNRLNCVLTREIGYEAEGAMVFHDINDWLDAFKNDEREKFIIGGAEIYRLALEMEIVDVMYITHVEADLNGDVYFPLEHHIDFKDSGVLLIIDQIDERNDHRFVVKKYTKIK